MVGGTGAGNDVTGCGVMPPAPDPHRGRWWVAVPDVAAAGPVVEAVLARCPAQAGAAVLATHPSGRPWLLGAYPARLLDVVATGPTRVAVMGVRGRTPAERGECERAALAGDLDRIARQPGVAHVVVVSGDRIHAYGDAVGLRPVMWSVRGGVALLTSHGRALRFGAAPDDAWLAARLLHPAMPSALAHRFTVFPGVRPVPPGSVATVRGAATVAVRRWWCPPAPEGLSLRDGAALLRSALAGAVEDVAERARGAGSVSVSIAGPYSLALAALCGQALPDVALLYVDELACGMVDSGIYARIAAGLQPRADGQRLLPSSAISFGSGLDQLPALDEPAGFTLGIARMADTSRRVAAWGAGAHVGAAGARLALAVPCAHLRGMAEDVRERHLRDWAFACGITARELGGLLDREPASYRDWLVRLAGAPRGSHRLPALGWEPAPPPPPWATAAAQDLVRRALLDVAEGAEPLGRDPGTHATLAGLAAAARQASLARDTAMAVAGVPVEYPFLDRRVVEACLSTAPEERAGPADSLALLTAAMPHLPVPREAVPSRRVPPELVAGLRENRDQLDALLDGSLLAGRGLVDPAPLRETLREPWCHEDRVEALMETLAVEVWLRGTDGCG